MVRLMDEDSKQNKEEVQRKEDAKEPCRECAKKDAEIAELKEELGRFHASMIAGRLNP